MSGVRESSILAAKRQCRADCHGAWCREQGRCIGVRFDDELGHLPRFWDYLPADKVARLRSKAEALLEAAAWNER